jgi:predicted amidophosphoribosyltransferase
VIWLADDILTTGGTALAASSALEASGHRVAGLICLARTPPPGRDLRCRGR